MVFLPNRLWECVLNSRVLLSLTSSRRDPTSDHLSTWAGYPYDIHCPALMDFWGSMVLCCLRHRNFPLCLPESFLPKATTRLFLSTASYHAIIVLSHISSKAVKYTTDYLPEWGWGWGWERTNYSERESKYLKTSSSHMFLKFYFGISFRKNVCIWHENQSLNYQKL